VEIIFVESPAPFHEAILKLLKCLGVGWGVVCVVSGVLAVQAGLVVGGGWGKEVVVVAVVGAVDVHVAACMHGLELGT
jgi:hypothetical protein